MLILSGPTHEYIDPVRFIGNASSGLMGKAIAEEAIKQSFAIDFISGPVSDSNLPELSNRGKIYRITSAEEMLNAAAERIESADAIIFAAAVADYTPAEKQKEKMDKSTGTLTLRLKPTADIAKTLCAAKRPEQVAIGFALQTTNGEEYARKKLSGKNLDGIVLNTPATLGAATGTFSFLSRDADRFEQWGCIGKPLCAEKIIKSICARLTN